MREKGMPLLIDNSAREHWDGRIDFHATADALVAWMRADAKALWYLSLPRTRWGVSVEFWGSVATVTFTMRDANGLRFMDIEYELLERCAVKVLRYRYELI